MIDIEYNYKQNKNGDAHFYLAQYKTNRMREWRYIASSGSLVDVQKALKESHERSQALKATGEKYYTSKNYSYRILKIDIELLPV
jgi:hypothetical protein